MYTFLYLFLYSVINFVHLDGFLEEDGAIVFETLEEMHALCASPDTQNQSVRKLFSFYYYLI